MAKHVLPWIAAKTHLTKKNKHIWRAHMLPGQYIFWSILAFVTCTTNTLTEICEMGQI
jgi:hypothetical protein